MIPLNIALGPKAVCIILDKSKNRMKMQQHCLLYSDKMIERYMDIDEEAAESLMGYIDAHEGEVGFSKRIPDPVAAFEPFEQLFTRLCPKENTYFPSSVVILYEDECGREIEKLSKKKANILTTKEIERNRKNIFYMLSPDTGSFDVEPGEDCKYWAEYFSRIYSGENTIIFMNRYGLKNEAIKILKEYYLPFISQSTKIKLYASDSYICIKREEAINIIKEDDILNNYDIELYLIDSPHQHHERWIQTDNYYIYQGKGFDMLSCNRNKNTVATSTVLVEKRFRTLPKAERVI